MKYLLYISILMFFGCKKHKNTIFIKEKEFSTTVPKVMISIVKKTVFFTEIISNGKLVASQKIDMKFLNEGIVEKIYVNNGSTVKKGQLIASQKTTYLTSEKRKNKELLDMSLLNIQDVLLGFGYNFKDSLNIPKDIMDMAKVRSGLAETKNKIQQTKKRYEEAIIRAPFSGVIANKEITEKNFSSQTKKVCTLINNETFFVDFYILENEYGIIEKGDNVRISPLAFPNQFFFGEIAYINPTINENGLILVKARVTNKKNLLIDGMNVHINIRKNVGDCISIPKRAIVDRQNKKVVFTYKKGEALWNYITTSHETTDSIVVTKGLKVFDSIIIEGNVNLAHKTKVQLIN